MRKTGYREKQFDSYFRDILASDVEIITIKTQSHTGPAQSGMWIIIILRAKTKEANIKLSQFENNDEIFSTSNDKDLNSNNDYNHIQIND